MSIVTSIFSIIAVNSSKQDLRNKKMNKNNPHVGRSGLFPPEFFHAKRLEMRKNDLGREVSYKKILLSHRPKQIP